MLELLLELLWSKTLSAPSFGHYWKKTDSESLLVMILKIAQKTIFIGLLRRPGLPRPSSPRPCPPRPHIPRPCPPRPRPLASPISLFHLSTGHWSILVYQLLSSIRALNKKLIQSNNNNNNNNKPTLRTASALYARGQKCYQNISFVESIKDPWNQLRILGINGTILT